MKKIVLGILLGSLFVNNSLVFADEVTTSSTDETADKSVSIDEQDVLYQQYMSDSRREVMSFEEYQAFNQSLSDNLKLHSASVRSATFTTNSMTQQIVNRAKYYIGRPYAAYPANTLGPNTFDCSGLVYRVFLDVLGKDIVGKNTREQVQKGSFVSFDAMQPGDLIYWGDTKNPYHVAIYIGNNQYIHAPKPGENVTTSPIWWDDFKPSFAKRINLGENTTVKPPITATPAPAKPVIDLSKYWTTSPGKVVNLKAMDYYRSPEFSSATRVGTYGLATRLDIASVVKNKEGVPVLKLKNGYYVMAERYWMQKFTYTSMKTTKYSLSTNKTTLYKNITLMTAKSNSSRGKVFNVKGKYVLENGAVIYSLYKQNGSWAGYILNKDVKQVKYIAWNKKVVITKKNYATYNNFFFSSKKIANTSKHLNKQYTAKGYYVLGNGRKYLSLYDKNNKWCGYLNATATKTVK